MKEHLEYQICEFLDLLSEFDSKKYIWILSWVYLGFGLITWSALEQV
jgi:hypothetical protein